MKTFADEAKNIQLNIDAKEFAKLRECIYKINFIF